MSTMAEGKPDGAEDVNARIAARVRELRSARGYSLDALAARCDVSRSTISLIERNATNPTAVLLERLATGLDVPLASLFEPTGDDQAPTPLARRASQPLWRDPASGYLRRTLSPAGWPSPLQLVEVTFPAGATVAYETAGRDVQIHQQVWLLAGRLDIGHGDETYHLEVGDCLAMRVDRPITFHNPTRRAARYAVAVVAEPPAGRRAS